MHAFFSFFMIRMFSNNDFKKIVIIEAERKNLRWKYL